MRSPSSVVERLPLVASSVAHGELRCESPRLAAARKDWPAEMWIWMIPVSRGNQRLIFGEPGNIKLVEGSIPTQPTNLPLPAISSDFHAQPREKRYKLSGANGLYLQVEPNGSKLRPTVIWCLPINAPTVKYNPVCVARRSSFSRSRMPHRVLGCFCAL